MKPLFINPTITVWFFDESNPPVLVIQAETENVYDQPMEILVHTSAGISKSIDRLLAPQVSLPLGKKGVLLAANQVCQSP